MKTYYLILVLCCGLYACNKEPLTREQEAKNNTTGAVTAIINGTQQWVSTYADYASNRKNGFNINSALYKEGIVRQSLGLVNVKPVIGLRQQLVYLLSPDGHENAAIEDSAICSFTTVEDDAVDASYFVLDSSDSYVIVDEYDADKHRLKGRFQAIMFTIDKPTQGYTDTIRILDGTFDVGIQKQE